MSQHDPDQQKNLMIAVGLSMAVLVGWQIFYAGPKMKEEQARQQVQQEQSQATSPGTAPATDTSSRPPVAASDSSIPGTAPLAAPAETRAQAINASPRHPIKTPSLEGSINLKSGRIDDLVLVKFHETVDPTSPNVTLFSPTNSPHPYFAEYGWVPQGTATQKLPGRDTVWTAESSTPLTPSSPVTLTWDNGEGLLFKRTISVDDDYLFTIEDAVENRGSADVTLAPYARIHRYGTPKLLGYFILHEGPIGVIGETDGFQEIDYDDLLEDGPRTFPTANGGWLGFTDKYWASALVPDQSQPYRAQFSGQAPRLPNEQPAYQTDYLRAAVTIPPGETRSIKAGLFAGAKEVKLLQQYQADPGILKFDLLIDWGWFFFITKPLYYLMEWINSYVHNFGVTIIVLTVLVRLAFFPLANKQFASMAKMKKLQPQMEELRERFKDDKMRQQQALMELYKKEKVNPIAGCVPILLQLPVFFALYKVLFITIDMRHAPFFGWIQDLSAPDPTSLFNLFGLLPFAVPEFLHIGVWPLIMGITMWLQMQLNPQQPDPVQQQIFNWMPIVFTFLLASFPAGLVIYWAWSNTLSLAQQYYIMKRHGAEIHLMGNLSRQFKSLAGAPGMITDMVRQRPPGSKSGADEKDTKDSSATKPRDDDKG
jgi:YidC/Oxa1 family membrane protein insertase